MFKRALISVSDKSGLIDFLKPLVALTSSSPLQLVSSGGTAAYLRENGFAVIDVSEQTGFPEVMGGRVKTLHPHIHMALLHRGEASGDLQLLKEHGLEPFDLVIVNLYPFEKTFKSGATETELIEKIDVGGPAMLRASAKNFKHQTVICSPNDYAWVLENVQKKDWNISHRQRLAAKVFEHTSQYDQLISEVLNSTESSKRPLHHFEKVMDLRYGENPHQNASWYSWTTAPSGLHQAQVLQGKVLSYNNLLDLQATVDLVKLYGLNKESGQISPSEFISVAVKHNNPCGVGLSKNSFESLTKALQADPVSVFGGIVAVNFKIESAHANALKEIFLEALVAPSYSEEALQIFAVKKNFRVLSWPDLIFQAPAGLEIKSLAGGFLAQSKDQLIPAVNSWTLHGATNDLASATPDIIQDLQLAEKVCMTLKSNAIALVAQGQTVGLGMGQVNRVEAVEHAISRWKKHHPQKQQVVMASDAFFPFPDSIEVAARVGIQWIIQPGGSIKDKEVFARAQELGVNIVINGTRHFRH